MSVPTFVDAPTWAILLSLAAHLTGGVVLGVLYFQALWLNAQQFIEGGRTVVAIGLMFGRFALLGGLLFLASREGAMPLLVTALGVLVARFAVMRRVQEAQP